jgi:hypothetical protein
LLRLPFRPASEIARKSQLSKSNYCFGVEPFVERLLSGFLLSDAPGMSFDSPLVPVEVPLAPVFIESVFGPTDLEGDLYALYSG